jgi:hypothetical protein
MHPILITHPVSGKVVGSFTAPPWLSQPTEDSEELHMPLPMFLTLCGLLPFLFVSILHLVYAYKCWPQYTQGLRWFGMLVLNLLVIVPYLNMVAFPALLLWLCVALLGCRRAPVIGGGVRPKPAVGALSETASLPDTSGVDSAALSLE